MELEKALHHARALVLHDLSAGGADDAEVVSLLEDAITHRRWWVEQWPQGAGFLPGLVAQDMQDALLTSHGRWPLCPLHRDSADPHALVVEPELGEDAHWVCPAQAEVVAAVGELR
ncbi:hypothetical protein [Allostreptomyces psammosilenae]|uniref:Uncharacterized protein n=1 Tax=Allostreptomyces psammosilenae TaxID=1892865 RepID=A0A853AAV2_9ACTN|nr:hypothetical protein [Allostreptomyces psammosilenae]NYI07638.1 hypothetical protein [Allostreptomyces psammosilenae]